MSDFDINILKEKTEKSLNVLREELGTVRAGRANAALVDKVTVDYYGSPTPLKALSNISVPDPRTLMISPFDPKSIPEIEHAINAANIGINPVNDGKVIRLQIPQVTEERRKELTKVVKKMGEDTKVAVRNLRRDANDKVKKMEKAGDFTEDDAKGTLDDIQKLIDKTMSNIKEVKARGAKVLAVVNEGNRRVFAEADDVLFVPVTDPVFSGIPEILPLQLFAYHVARCNGCDIDKPRNLAKSVTVE